MVSERLESARSAVKPTQDWVVCCATPWLSTAETTSVLFFRRLYTPQLIEAQVDSPLSGVSHLKIARRRTSPIIRKYSEDCWLLLLRLRNRHDTNNSHKNSSKLGHCKDTSMAGGVAAVIEWNTIQKGPSH